MGWLSAFLLCFLLCIIMETPGIFGQNTKPVFKVEAPNILCSKGSGQPSVFSINLIPATADQKLKYHIKISYEYSIPKKTQHHSLSLWRTIRTLEQQLNTQRTSIDAENKIDIATSNLTPGVIYMFDIQGEDAAGVKSDVERFILDYKDGNLYRMCKEQSDTQDVVATTTMMSGTTTTTTTMMMTNVDATTVSSMNTMLSSTSIEMLVTNATTTVKNVAETTTRPNEVANEINSSDINENFTEEISSITLNGPSKIYANVPLIIKADQTFTGNPNEYYIQWNIDNFPSEFKNILACKGPVLTIPPYALKSGQEYVIEADLMDASNSKSVAKANHTIIIEKHELRVSIIPVNALIGVGRSIDIELKIHDFNVNQGRLNIQWRCVVIEAGSEAESLCDRFNVVSEPKKSIVFTKPGNYHIHAMVVNEMNLTSEVISTIQVQNEIVAKITIDSMPQMPVDVTKWIRGQASISYVVPKCVAKWAFVKEDGYAYVDSSVLQGTGIGELIVNDFEANFLKELNDYTNSTVTKHVKLHIPPANTYPNWNGLEVDSKYKLRITTDCPEPIDLDNTNAPASTKRIESYLEMELETNSPPKTSPIDISPSEGFALITPYIMKTSPAKDKNGPLLYAFGIIVDGITFVLDRGYDMYQIQSHLPYSKNPIEPFYEVCDIYKACSVQFGPSISNNMSSYLVFDFTRTQLDSIESGFDRGEYNTSLNNILILGLTLKHSPDERIYKEFHQNVIQMIKAETKRILKIYDDKSVYLSEQDIFDYVQNVKLILETFDIRDREIIQNLLSLLEKVSGKSQEAMNEARDIKRRRRRKRQIENTYENPVVNLAIAVLALLPVDFSRTKEELRWMCRYTEHIAEKNMTEYHTVKYNKTRDFRKEMFKVPHVGLEWTANVKLNNIYDFDPNIEYCLGSAYDKSYPYIYPFYQLYVFYSNDSQNFQFLESTTNKVNDATKDMLEISIHLNNTIKPENTACEMLIDDNWVEDVCKTTKTASKVLMCNCTRNEPFRVKFLKPKASVEVMDSLTPAAITQSMEVTTVQIQVTSTKEQTVSTELPMMSNDGASGSTLATVGYSALGLLGLGGVFGAISYYLHRNSKKKSNTFALDLQAIAAEARTKTPGITYARFHDEHMMNGDKVTSTTPN